VEFSCCSRREKAGEGTRTPHYRDESGSWLLMRHLFRTFRILPFLKRLRTLHNGTSQWLFDLTKRTPYGQFRPRQRKRCTTTSPTNWWTSWQEMTCVTTLSYDKGAGSVCQLANSHISKTITVFNQPIAFPS